MAPGTMGPSLVGTTAATTQVATAPVSAPAPVTAPPVPNPTTTPVVSTGASAQQDVNNKMGAMTSAGPALTPAQIQANIAQQNTATPNSTAVGPTPQTGALIADPNLPKDFAKDATGRIFKIPEGTTIEGTKTATTGGAGTTTGGTGTGTGTGTTGGTGTGETGGADAAAAAQAARDAATKINQDKADTRDTQTLNDIAALKNGTFALTPDQQSQVDAMTQKYGLLVDQQKTANKNYEGAITQAGIAAGRNMYAPEVELGNIAAAVSAGNQAVAQINSEMFTAISQAKDAFAKNDLALINASYSVYKDAVNRRQKAIDDTYKNVTDAIKAAQDAAHQKTQDALTLAQIQELENRPLNQQSQAVQGAVANIMQTYPDAGIDINDTPAQIAEKVKNSESFKNAQAKKLATGTSAQWKAVRTWSDQNGIKHTTYQNMATGATSNDAVPQGDTIVGETAGNWSTQTGMRTDRNNNPIAVSNAAPEFMDVLKKAGINFTTEEGADFGGGLKTLKFATPQDGVEASRALLAGSPMAFSWYSNHTGKAVLDQYGIHSNADFAKASKETQDAVIKGIYQSEGGSGSLVGEAPTAAATQETAIQKKYGFDDSHMRTVKDVADYTYNASNLPKAGAERRSVMDAAKELNPNFTESDYDVRYKFKQNWSQGTMAKTIVAVNTFANHIGELTTVMNQAANSGQPLYNILKGTADKWSGNTGLTPANATIDSVATEFAKILKGGDAAPTTEEIKSAKTFLSSTQSPQQTASVIKTLSDLMGGRVNALRDQYRDPGAMGTEAPPVLNDSARKSLRAAGLDPDTIETSIRTPATDEQMSSAPTGSILYYGNKWYIKNGTNDYQPY